MLRKIVKDFHRNIKRYIHGNERSCRESLKVTRCISWILIFVEHHGQDAPDEETKILAPFLYKGALYHIYKEECVKPTLSRSHFYKTFKARFGVKRIDKTLPRVRISKYSTHSRCSECEALEQKQRSARTEEEIQIAKDLMRIHISKYSGARAEICRLEQLAIKYPRKYLLLQTDGMDNIKGERAKFLSL